MMPHRVHSRIYHFKVKDLDIGEVEKISKEVLAAYHVTLQDFAKLTPISIVEDLFVDLYVNCNGAYIVTNCVIVDERLDSEIIKCKSPYHHHITYTIADVNPEINSYLNSEDRIKESALVFVLLQLRGKLKSDKDLFDFLNTPEGEQKYKLAYEFFKKEYGVV